MLGEQRFVIAAALRRTMRAGYALRDLKGDLIAGMIVGVVALPLSMALAIASGVPPQHGLYTAIVAGGVTALLGGSSMQVTGPTAAFVVILAPISAKFGPGGLMVATLLAGFMLVIAGIARLGRLIEFIPYPVTTGFTSGIAVVIATLQLKDFFGLQVGALPEHYVSKVGVLIGAFPTMRWTDLAVGVLTLCILVLLPRVTRRVPSPLVALPVAAIVGYLLHRVNPSFDIATIQSRFSYVRDGVTHGGIPQLPPMPVLPWNCPGPDGVPLIMTMAMLRDLIPSAFAIAMLGAIESLLSAVVADGMTGLKHDPDAELIAQGAGNMAAPFFGGIAATGAIARTATNIRCGGRSPMAAFFHSVFILAAVMVLAPALGYLPMSAMAALLLVVAWNMSEFKHFMHLLRVGPGSDVLVLVTCFGLTVAFDMVVSVSVGVVLAALLLMRRMADLSSVRLVDSHPFAPGQALPEGLVVYEIAGPLFFGAAQKAMSSLRTVQRGIRAVVLDMQSVPAMDATGLVNLESAIDRLRKSGVFVVLAGVQKQPLRILARAGWKDRQSWVAVHGTMEAALEAAKRRLDQAPRS